MVTNQKNIEPKFGHIYNCKFYKTEKLHRTGPWSLDEFQILARCTSSFRVAARFVL